jgi:hypothetical protein
MSEFIVRLRLQLSVPYRQLVDVISHGLDRMGSVQNSEVEVPLRLTVSLGVEPAPGLVSFCPKVVVLSLSDERSGHLSPSARSNLSVCTSSIHVSCALQFCNLCTSFSPGSVQQIMLY